MNRPGHVTFSSLATDAHALDIYHFYYLYFKKKKDPIDKLYLPALQEAKCREMAAGAAALVPLWLYLQAED